MFDLHKKSIKTFALKSFLSIIVMITMNNDSDDC